MINISPHLPSRGKTYISNEIIPFSEVVGLKSILLRGIPAISEDRDS